MALTRRQREVLDVIREFIGANGYSPSLEEIGGALGLSSVATVHKHVTHLVNKGYARRAWNQNRSIELVEPSEGTGSVALPLAGRVSDAVPLEIDGSSSETVRVPAEIIVGRARSIVVRVEGDGFLDEQVRDGDFLVVEQRDAPRDGETVLAVVDGIRTVLGGFRREGTAIRLMPAAATRESAPLDAMRVAIQGVVVSLIRRY